MRISDWSSDVCSSDLNLDLPIPLPKIEAFRLRGGADREMTIPELFVAGKDSSQPEQTRLESRANFHFRIVERSEEHTSELQSLMRISYAVFCLKKKKHKQDIHHCQNKPIITREITRTE